MEGPPNSKSKQVRQRASKPKVRTGCVTCKKRHVKCDEAKPLCGPCRRLELECEGYKIKQETDARGARTLLPRPGSQLQTRPLSQSMRPSMGFALSHDDSWYFSIFRGVIVHQLDPNGLSSFWSRTSLRDFMGIECIRESILSIGAQSFAVQEESRLKPTKEIEHSPRGTTGLTNNRHHRAALQHHARALACLRAMISRQGIDDRLVMVATLLFFVFEWLMGSDVGSILSHGISAMRRTSGTAHERAIMRQRKFYKDPDLRTEMEDMSQLFLRVCAGTIFLSLVNTTSAFQLLLTGDENLGIARRIPLEALTRCDLEAPQTLEQAYRKWDILFPLVLVFQMKIRMHDRLSKILGPLSEELIREKHELMLDMLREFKDEVEALKSSLPEASSAEYDRARERLDILLLEQSASYIFTFCCTDMSEKSYDDCLPQLRDVVDRCRPIVDRTASQRLRFGFSSNHGVLLSLTFVGSKCRNRALRLEVLDLLSRLNSAEDQFRSLNLSRLRSQMKLEGQSPDRTGVPCSESDPLPDLKDRWNWSTIYRDCDRGRAGFEFVKNLPDSSGVFEKKTVWVYS